MAKAKKATEQAIDETESDQITDRTAILNALKDVHYDLRDKRELMHRRHDWNVLFRALLLLEWNKRPIAILTGDGNLAEPYKLTIVPPNNPNVPKTPLHVLQYDAADRDYYGDYDGSRQQIRLEIAQAHIAGRLLDWIIEMDPKSPKYPPSYYEPAKLAAP